MGCPCLKAGEDRSYWKLLLQRQRRSEHTRELESPVNIVGDLGISGYEQQAPEARSSLTKFLQLCHTTDRWTQYTSG